MSKRFESDEHKRHIAGVQAATLHGARGRRIADERARIMLGRAAVREAERILGETEPFEGGGWSLSAAYTRFRPSSYSAGAVAALAESLAAVLPVLDELAADTCGTALFLQGVTSLGVESINAHAMMTRRNRATLDAMGGRPCDVCGSTEPEPGHYRGSDDCLDRAGFDA
jgi:hypothetical protein